MKNFTILSVLILLLFSCSKKNGPKSSDKVITKFVFTKTNNPSLTEDVEGVITGNEIKVVLHGSAKTSLKPTITYTSKSINSNEEAKDFTNPVVYTLTAEDGSTVNYTIKVDTRDVYISGLVGDASNNYPVYWKNGNKVILPIANGVNARTFGVVVNGNDVYVAGSTSINGSSVKAVYWKNGTLVELAPSASSSETMDIKLHNGNVYILGYIYRNASKKDFVYWKNGVETIIVNDDIARNDISCIYVNGSDVYAGGYTIVNGERKAAYWKNGNEVVLSNESSDIYSLMIISNDIYVFGSYNYSGTYWKNGTKNTFQFSSNDNIENGTVVGNDIYMVGDHSDASKNTDIAAYWKNGIKTNLSDGTKNAYAPFITAVDNDIYIGGVTQNLNNNNIYSPIYWINGKKININSEENCRVSSIFVKSN